MIVSRLLAPLRGIIDAVGSYIQVHRDAGICSGRQVRIAAALDAKSAYTDTNVLYGLRAKEERNVTHALRIILRELP